MKYTAGYTQHEGLPASPDVVFTTFQLTLRNEIVRLTFLSVIIPSPPEDQRVPITTPQINSNLDKVYIDFDNKGESKLSYDEATGNLVVNPNIRDGWHKATLTLPD